MAAVVPSLGHTVGASSARGKGGGWTMEARGWCTIERTLGVTRSRQNELGGMKGYSARMLRPLGAPTHLNERGETV